MPKRVQYDPAGPGGELFPVVFVRDEATGDTRSEQLDWLPEPGEIRELPDEIAAALNHPRLRVLGRERTANPPANPPAKSAANLAAPPPVTQEP